MTADELFGALSGDGFADLALLDTNNDDKIDAADTDFADLKVWIDADGDGAADTGEVVSLASAGVTAINLTRVASGANNNGNTVVATATFVRSDNTTSTVAEVNFATDTLYSRYVPGENFEYSNTAFTLPSLTGYGNVPDLIYSMSLDLRSRGCGARPRDGCGLPERERVPVHVRDLRATWAGVADVNPTSRGPLIDARHVALVEAFYGATYAQLNGANASLNSVTSPISRRPITRSLTRLMIRFAAQVPLSQLLNGVSLDEVGRIRSLPFASIRFDAAADAISVDFSTLVADIVEAAPAGAPSRSATTT